MRPAVCIAVAVLTSILMAASLTSAAENLEAAWMEALARNPQLAAVAIDASAAQIDLEAARLQRRPNAWIRSSYAVRSEESSFRFDNPLVSGQTFTEPFRQREGAGSAAAVSIPLYAGGRISNSISGAAARLTAANHATSMSKMELLLDVAEAYVAVLRSQRQLEVARQNLHGLQAHQEEVHRHFDQRQVPQTDLLAAQVTTSTAQQLELRRQHQIETLRGEYNRLLGRPLDAPVVLDEISMPSLSYNLEELKGVGLQKRPDLAELQAAADARRF